MFDIKDILYGKPKKAKMVNELDKILPKQENILPKEPKVIVHNHYYNMPKNMSFAKQKKFSLTTIKGKNPFDDDDKDGYPNYMDPQPNNPEQPKKKLIWEKALQSIYRNERG